MTKNSDESFLFYENSVQSPEIHARWCEEMYREIRNASPKILREDFCGTFLLCCEWVKRNPSYQCIGIDCDSMPLVYGKKKNLSKLTADQKSRVKLLQADVCKFHPQKADIISVGNFSFYCLKDRAILLNYFKNCLKSLKKNGILILEMAGGPGMIETLQEKKKIKLSSKVSFTYIWDQISFDPIGHEAQYAIHFKKPGKPLQKNAFFYDWRLWTLPEVKDILLEAGFQKTFCYWESSHRGKGTGEYVITEKGDNAHAWIAYAIGVA